jgi:hypothetical protein
LDAIDRTLGVRKSESERDPTELDPGRNAVRGEHADKAAMRREKEGEEREVREEREMREERERTR